MDWYRPVVLVLLALLVGAIFYQTRYITTGLGQAQGGLVIDTWTWSARACHPGGCEGWAAK